MPCSSIRKLILVNDGSTDGSLSICQRYAAQDSRVKVIQQENQGVSAARNTGMDRVTGAYIAFIDSDDHIDSEYLSTLLSDALIHCADLVCCDFYDVVNGKFEKLNTPRVLHNRQVESWEDLFRDAAMSQEDYGCCVWGKLIKTELARKCRFPSMRYGEDQIYMFDLFLQNPVVYLTNYPGYYYVLNEHGAMQSAGDYNIVKCLDDIQMRRYKLEKLPVSAQAIRQLYVEQYANSVLALGRSSAYETDPVAKKQARTAFLQEMDTVWKERHMVPLRHMLHLLFCRWMPGLYYRIIAARAGLQSA